jgi:4-hydroxybutyrate CoA-transferase
LDWREEYKKRLASADDAMRIVNAGDLVMIPIAGPRTLQGALYRRAKETGPIDLRLAAPLTDPGWVRGESSELFRMEFELFIGDFGRQATDEARATYLPNLFSSTFKGQDDGRLEHGDADVFLTSVTPPDEDGYVQFGAHNWNKRMYVRHALKTIAEVDAGLRPVFGDNKIHVSEFTHFVEVPPVEITRPMVDAWLRRVDDAELKAEYESLITK